MFKKGLALLFGLILIIVMIAGCGNNSSSNDMTSEEPAPVKEPVKKEEPQVKKEPVKLKFFTGKVETVDFMNDLIAKFNAENPDIIVEQEYQKEASNVIKVKFASGDIPDITTVSEQDYIDQGKYLDLSGEAFWSRVRPSIKDLSTDIKTGKQFRVATNVTTAGIFYNKKIFAELGLKEALTWEEFKSNLETVKAKKPDVVPMFLAGKESWTLNHLIEFMAHGVIKQKLGVYETRKAFINNESDKLQFDAPGGSMETFAARLLELKNAGLINNDAVTATYDNQKEAFATGKAALISQGIWVLGELLNINPDFANDIGFSPFPPIVDGTQPTVISADDSRYAITSDSKHQEEAKKFLEFLFRPENLQAYSEFTKTAPAFTDVTADWGPLKDQVGQALKTGVNIAFSDNPSGFSGDDAGRMVQELLVGKYKEPMDFAKAYRETWDKAWNATNK